MKWRNRSLRRRLALWLIVPLVLVSAIMLMEVRSSAQTAANQAYDRVLLGSALAIAERVAVEGSEVLVDVPYVALDMLTSAAQDRVFYQVSGPGGQFITGYSDLPDLPENLSIDAGLPVFYDSEYKGSDVRIGVVPHFVSSPKLSARVLVKVAETTEARNALIAEMFEGAALRQALLIAAGGLILWIGLGWGLRPLANLEQALNRRSPKDLRPILHEVPHEVRNLVGAINHLMERLGDSIGSMQRFTANAAHQLRTPLAAIQTQAELALDEKDPGEIGKTLGHLRRSSAQTSRLVNQLLSLARSETDSKTETDAEFDLVSLCKDMTRSMVPMAIENNIDLGFEEPSKPVVFQGEAALVEEMLRNLVHNALSHCPGESHVTVGLGITGPGVELTVEDDGPGIPAADREKVFERFYRVSGSSDASGCGLGLPIVREIARRHGGGATIETGSSGKGARVRVVLPRARVS